MPGFDDDFLSRHRRQQELLRQMASVSRAMTPTTALMQAAREMQEHYNRVHQSLVGPTYNIKHLQAAAQALNPRILNSSPFALEQTEWLKIQRSITASNDLSARLRHLTETSPLVWQSSLSTLLEQLKRSYPSSGAAALSGLLSPPLDYSRFARQALARAAEAPVAEARALRASVVLAEVQLTTGTELLTSIMPSDERTSAGEENASSHGAARADGPHAEEDQQEALTIGTRGDNEPGAAALFLVQQEELLAAGVAEDANYSQLITLSPVAQTVAGARGLTELVVDINRTCLLGGREEIFPPTTAMLQSVNDLSYLNVRDRATLGIAVDALYMLLYEGSGEAARMRVWLPDNACEALWDLKQLRNVWLRHDPEHGAQTAQAKKWAKLAEALERFGTTSLPKSASEFRTLYDALLQALSNMLLSLQAAIIATP